MNDETTKTPGPSGPSTPAGGEHAGAKKRRRRKSGKPAVLSAKAQPAPADAARALIDPILEGRADMTVGDRLSNGAYASKNTRAKAV